MATGPALGDGWLLFFFFAKKIGYVLVCAGGHGANKHLVGAQERGKGLAGEHDFFISIDISRIQKVATPLINFAVGEKQVDSLPPLLSLLQTPSYLFKFYLLL